MSYIKSKIMSLLSVLGIYIGTILLFGCPIKFVTGVSCPACGMTRAWSSVLLGDISDAFYYHPLFLLGPVLLATIFWEGTHTRKWAKTLLICLSGIFLLIYILRIFVFPNEIVTIEIDKNIFSKGCHWLGNI